MKRFIVLMVSLVSLFSTHSAVTAVTPVTQPVGRSEVVLVLRPPHVAGLEATLFFHATSHDAAIALSMTHRDSRGRRIFEDLELYEFAQQNSLLGPSALVTPCISGACKIVAGDSFALRIQVPLGRELVIGEDRATTSFSAPAAGWSLRRQTGSFLRASSDPSLLKVILPDGEAIEYAAMPTLSVQVRFPAIAFAFLPCDRAGTGSVVLNGPGIRDNLNCSDLVSDVISAGAPGLWSVAGTASGITGFSTRLAILSAP